jgi:MATE family multidrug resistance protein
VSPGERLDVISGALNDLLRLAWPVVMSRLGIMTMGLVDTAVVGHFSTEQLGFHALAWALSGAVLMAGIGLLQGVQVMTARHLGEGRPEATGGVLRRGAVYGLWVGLAGMALLMLGGPMFLSALGLEPRLAAGAGVVLLIFAASLPLTLIGTAASSYLEALSRPKPVMTATWVCNGLNLALDLILVPGLLGLPAMGAQGAAWGTFVARLALMIWLFIHVARMKDARALGVFASPVDGRRAAVEQRRIGYGAGASLAVEASAFSGMSIVAGWIGGLAVAAWGIMLNVSAIIFMLPLGLATATAVLVSRAHGAGDHVQVRRVGLLGFGVTVGVLTVIAGLVLAFARPITLVFTPDPALIQATVTGLMLCSLFFVADGLQVVAAQALRARSDIVIPTTTHVFSYVLVMAPLAWWLALPMEMGLNGIVWAVVTASLIAAGSLLGRFWWITQRRRRV